VPLFGYAGFGMSRVARMPDGRYENLHQHLHAPEKWAEPNVTTIETFIQEAMPAP
jgi:hypothetical protein